MYWVANVQLFYGGLWEFFQKQTFQYPGVIFDSDIALKMADSLGYALTKL